MRDELDARRGALSVLFLALIAYVPAIASAPGRVSADTKQYLYLDPGRLLARAPYLWDTSSGFGTVPHQNIGYLFPMGPYYWLTDALGVPDWLAQRIWLGSILFAAGTGVMFLLSTLGWRHRSAAMVAALVYMLTPYQLAYSARTTAILLPWAGLPWMVAIIARAVRRGGWRDPALFALVVLTVGGTNATALLLVGLAPFLWLVFAVVRKDATWRQARDVALRIGALVGLTSLWWIAGLWAQGRYGLNYLQLSESVQTVADSSSPTEVLRGLGNWFFYGGDALGPWVEQAVDLTQRQWLLVASFALPLAAFAAAAVTRWRHRSYFVALATLGVVASVGAYPYDDPSPLGSLFKAFATGSTVGLAMRSTPRAVPLVVLSFAVLTGAGLVVARRLGSRVQALAFVVVGVLAIATFAPAWGGGYVSDRQSRPEKLPAHVPSAAAALDREGDDTRVLEIPGIQAAAYRWGNAVDPVLPGLIDRPWVGRELIPFGSPESANLLIALDHRFQEGTFEPASLPAVARMMNVGTVALRSDLEYERYGSPRPRVLWSLLTQPRPDGLGVPEPFGPAVPNEPTTIPYLDAVELRTAPSSAWPAPIVLFPVEGTPPIMSTAPVRNPVIFSGDGEGIVDAAAAGVLEGTELVLYSASFGGNVDELRRELGRGAALVVTDTNRRRARRWGTIRDTTGPTERAGQVAVEEDTADQRLEVFPGAGDETRTVMEQRGVRAVDATGFGQQAFYTPDDRPAHAFDGDPATAWRVGGGGDPVGERLVIDLGSPVTTDHVTLTQPLGPGNDRFLTQVRLTFDGGEPLTVDLTRASRRVGGQRVAFRSRTFERLEVELLATNTDAADSYGGLDAVGFSEVGIPGRRVDEVVRLPVDLVRAAGADAAERPLVYVMTRLRYEPGASGRDDEESHLSRSFEVPTERAFRLSGQARVDPNAADALLDEVLGTTAVGTQFSASSHLRGHADARASRAFDGDRASAWSTRLGDQRGQWIQVRVDDPITIDDLDLEVVADGRHSVPLRVVLEVDGEPVRSIDLPAIADAGEVGASTRVPLSFEPVTGAQFRVVVDEVRPVTTIDRDTQREVTLPVSLAEVAIPGVGASPAAEDIATSCRDDLLEIDDEPIGVIITGSASVAAAHGALELAACDGSPLLLEAGSHVLRSTPGSDTGFDVDRVVLSSDRDGLAAPVGPIGARRDTSGASVRVVRSNRVGYELEVTTDGDPFWLELGESSNEGWAANAAGDATVGPRQLVSGYANGWEIRPNAAGTFTVELRWTPQRTIWWALGLSALGVLLCLVLVLRRRGVVFADAEADRGGLAWMSPFATSGLDASWRLAAGVGAGVAVVAGAVSRPWVGLLVGIAAAASLRWGRARPVLTIGAVVALAVSVVYVVAQQGTHDYPTIGTWPANFDAISGVTWLGVLLLAADVVVQGVRRRVRS
ncbi:MAG: alpha-(1-_3)-arabinofuranosyltransferase family protein [Acidimicrobiia bacterium]